MSSKEAKVSDLLSACRRYNLVGLDFLKTLSLRQLVLAYNGIGPESFHPALRKAVNHLAAALRPAALIHDVRFTYGNGSRAWFDRANDELKANCLSIANQKYRWYNPMRYITCARARTYVSLCRAFGWEAYLRACEKK